MFGRIGPMELILIFSIALIIFGPKKLPEIGKAIGSAIQNFKRHSNSLTEGLDSDTPGSAQQPAAGSASAENAKPAAAPESRPVKADEPQPKDSQ